MWFLAKDMGNHCTVPQPVALLASSFSAEQKLQRRALSPAALEGGLAFFNVKGISDSFKISAI